MLRMRVSVTVTYACLKWCEPVYIVLTSFIFIVSSQNYIEQLGAQIIGALIMIGIGFTGSLITYSALYFIPISPFVWVFDK